MHPAPIFRMEAAGALADHLRQYPLATITAAPEGVLRVAQAPVLLREVGGGLVLDFHLSRNNALAAHLVAGFEAVAVSLGPEAYISPDWYASEDQVPTWNYVSLEAQGLVSPLDEEALVALLDDLSAQEEAKLAPKPAWTRAIVGARLTVNRLDATFKLSQNKTQADIDGVIFALADHPLALAMQEVR